MVGGTIITIDGRDFSTLDEFYDVVGRLIAGSDCPGRGNLDWFNDILYWPYGEKGARYTLVWRNSDESRRRLGHKETVRQLEIRGLDRFPCGEAKAVSEIREARRGTGPTVFDWLLEIIVGNREYVELRLE